MTQTPTEAAALALAKAATDAMFVVADENVALHRRLDARAAAAPAAHVPAPKMPQKAKPAAAATNGHAVPAAAGANGHAVPAAATASTPAPVKRGRPKAKVHAAKPPAMPPAAPASNGATAQA